MARPTGRATKTLHVLGAGTWQVPTIQIAKRLGYRVFVTDMYEDAPGYAFADAHEAINIRDRAKTLAAARAQRVDGIICDTTDVGVPTAAFVADALGLPGIGYETALRFTDKFLMREATKSCGVHAPKYQLLTDPAEHVCVGFPCIVKPTDSQSSRGVKKVEAAADLPSALRDAFEHSASRRVLVEEFIDGIEVTVEGACQAGTVYVLGISDKKHYADRPQVASQLAYPPALEAVVIQRIAEANERVVTALGLQTGVTHGEFIVRSDGEVFLVEIAARGGGSRIYSHIVPYLSGIPVPELYVRHSVGETHAWPMPNRKGKAALLEFFSCPMGVVRAVHGVDEAARLPGVAELSIELRPGQYFAGIDNDRARPGYMLLFGKTLTELHAIATEVKALVRLEVESAIV